MTIESNSTLLRRARVSGAVVAAVLALTLSRVYATDATDLTTSFVRLSTGVTLQYVVQGDPAGPVIVLLHGVGDSWHSWELVLPHIPKTFRTYALTMRGHGLSDHPASGYSRADFAGDVTAWLRRLDLRDVTLAGHSLGSLVAQVVAENDGDRRLSRLVLVGSGPDRVPDPTKPSELSAYFAAVKDPIDYQFARDFQSGTAFAPLPPAFLETMIGEVMRVPAAMFHELAKGVVDPEHGAKLRRLTVKTLLVWGEKDAMFSRGDQDALVGLIRGSRLITYPNTGHALHWEQPERFAGDLVAFARQ